MLPLSKIAINSADHEEVFLGRYTRLHSWALQFTAGDRERAEDLVHDAFIQFTLTQPDLNSISNLDGYLYRMLRNLHLSQVRRSLREQQRTLSIVDYDSAEIGLRSSDPRHQIRLQDELRLVCHYACTRKETSKAGSVLILRFLHGYYAREIAQVMRSTREAAEERLRTARAEARQYLKDPNSLHFIREASTKFTPMGFSRATDELLREIRQTIFDSRQGDCLTTTEIERLYSEENISVDHITLAHMASCPECLDHVNSLLNLPLLAERFPMDTMGNDKGRKGDSGGSGDGPSGGMSESSLKRCRKRAKDVFEHRPSELCVSVNGYLMAAQNVASEVSEQTLSINVAEKIEFIEIFGEQDIRLLLLNVEELPPEGVYKRSVRVGLSDDRKLEATLSFSNPWPTLQVFYSDPLAGREAATQPVVVHDIRTPAEETQATSSSRKDRELESRPGLPGVQNVFVRRWKWFVNSNFLLRPAVVTAILSLFLVAALLVVRLRVPTASAAELLHRSIVAEDSVAANHGIVVHRRLTLEERRLSDVDVKNSVVARHRIEIWQSAAQGVKLRRIYDEQNNLIAGEWSKADGASTVYLRGRKPQTRTAPDVATNAILETGELWRLDSSAKNFQALVGNVAPVSVEETPDAYVLTFQTVNPSTNSKLHRAILKLNKSDLHATQQTLRVQRDGETREYKFTEESFRQDPAAAIAPNLLRPEPELLGETNTPKTDTGVASGVVDSLPGADVSPAEATASRELEIEVTYILDRIKSNLGEQVSMVRTTGGALHVEALVEGEGRKEEILRALAPLANNPAVKINVRTVAEAVERAPKTSRSGAMTSREVEVANGRIPVDAELRAYYSNRLRGNDAIDEEIDRHAHRVLGHSRQALLHASALKGLVERFPPKEISELSPTARAKWLAMIRNHTASYQREIAAVRRELRPIFYRAGEVAGGTEENAGATKSAQRLLQLSYANDEAVRSAFTIPVDGGTTAAIKSEQFWRSLSTAERLAAAIQSEYQK